MSAGFQPPLSEDEKYLIGVLHRGRKQDEAKRGGAYEICPGRSATRAAYLDESG